MYSVYSSDVMLATNYNVHKFWNNSAVRGWCCLGDGAVQWGGVVYGVVLSGVVLSTQAVLSRGGCQKQEMTS